MIITQAWGVIHLDANGNNIYKPFGFLRHNGTDYAQTPSKIVSSPLDGIVVRVGNQPTGGGIFVSVTDGKVLFDFLHCEKILVKEGDAVEEGQPIAIQDNTGFSTGPHTHIQPRPITDFIFSTRQWKYAVVNDANGTVDPETLWGKDHAEDIWKLKQQVSLLQKLISLAKQVYGKSK